MKNSLFTLLFLPVFALNVFAAGGLDSTFNVSVTEGFGYVNHTLTQADGKILAYGNFQKASGARTGSITRFNADGSLDATFNAGGSGANAAIDEAVLQPDGKLIIGGNFTVFNGTAINRLARLNPDGTLDSTFTPGANFANFIQEILIQPDGKIIAAAANTGSSPSSRLFRLNADGTLDAGFLGPRLKRRDLRGRAGAALVPALPVDRDGL